MLCTLFALILIVCTFAFASAEDMDQSVGILPPTEENDSFEAPSGAEEDESLAWDGAIAPAPIAAAPVLEAPTSTVAPKKVAFTVSGTVKLDMGQTQLLQLVFISSIASHIISLLITQPRKGAAVL